MIDRSATALVEALAAGRCSPVEVVDAAIARIEEVNGALNAVVATRFAEAREEARVAERRLRAGERLPLLGVPCTVKEFLAVRGMPHTAGIAHRRRVVADRDATVVRRVRAAGAIVLGVTNAPEGGLWPETNNPVHGRTHNPHDLARTPGGSSGGEGAILAAGGVPFGLGSDVGGSVRIPAHFCGICSHKPTGGTVPATGHFPHPPGVRDASGWLDRPMGIGPMARTVADLRRVLAVIAGPDGLDPQCDQRLELDAEVDWSKLEVVAMPTNGTFRPTRETEAAVHQSALALVERGAKLRPWRGPDLSRGFEQWAAVLAASGETYADLVTREGEAGWA
ncbi:MAG: amidase, partial [Myxococcota bacterium]